MGSKYRGEVDNLKSHITTLRVVIGIVVLFCFLFWNSANKARDVQRVFIPPDMRAGSTVTLNQVPATTAYSFAISIFSFLNTWLDDGSVEYPARVGELNAYLTPSYTQWLKEDILRRSSRGELDRRTRTVTVINEMAYDDERVEIINENNFVVWLDLRIKETHRGVDIKTVDIRYPLKVVRSDISLDFNPWGLQLDGFHGNPTRIPKTVNE
ncbi:MAG TPA: TIGR03746 family integrating conjugative element protein [Methylophaga sp.]|jgi:integrating conjugative element protein (TIGR03746 family)|uniref:PFL_4703 family integrating conjugative element protein n=2 Tax=Methylophaga TaxID=40222 RepID=UPI000C640D51|nr:MULTISPECIES: TIGR03746 family integrating conjugative element protein [unclassified Methylophaga]MAL50920.1 TIGR03746 family integrating conjugative element protein [Methylophaga sp.]MBP26150.1 TIGR03746 family integrating conjugative element protein [Methylophaga sp.]HCC79991.1 TIGR03746 family integrating conjugative element protein [Methylophaga sp.]|tara:strand:+ start:10455 stop:11087 length:633 start_codon:yes stop_codon:yes gene_type:complete